VVDKDLISSALRERVNSLPGEWQLIMEPTPSDLPPALASFTPDAVAIGPRNSIAFEVIVGRQQTASRAKVNQVQAMREAIKNLPQWDFELIILPEPEPPLATEPGIDDELQAARKVAPQSPSAAFMLAFAVLEWKLAQWSKTAGLKYEPAAARMASRLATRGIVSDYDYAKIREYQHMRNQIAHAMQRNFPLDTASVSKMIDFIANLDSRITEYSGLSRT